MSMAWLIARYQPVGLFSLKHGEATSTGGKSLFVPTPFAIRTALLDAAIRTDGLSLGERAFESIKSLRLALKPPIHVAVSGLFVKILKPERNKKNDRAMTPTIAFREYVCFQGELWLAYGGEKKTLNQVVTWSKQITYFGKRGSFFQLLEVLNAESINDEGIPNNFIALEGPDLQGGQRFSSFSLGVLQRLDDWGPDLTLDKVNIYSDTKIKLHKDRIRFDVVLPYHLVRAGRGFALYTCEKR